MLDLDKKLYQLIIPRLNGDELSSAEYRESLFSLVHKGIGGFIVFGGKKNEVKEFIFKLQSESEIPLFIASDIERGAGQQFEGASHLPSQMAMTAALDRRNPEDMQVLKKAIQAVAAEAIDIGVNMPLIPVLDVNSNPDNPIICTRAFSDRPEEVAAYGAEFIRVLEASGLMSCAKHFPGHGDTNIDSHISLPVISKSMDELRAVELFPYKTAIEAGVSAVMAGHLSVPAIDTVPASLSKKTITGTLREELGYEGLVMTDALNMHALQKFENIPARCIGAGVDIILHPAEADQTVEELTAALGSGMLTEEAIESAHERIMKYKERWAVGAGSVPDYIGHTELFREISDRSITLIKGSASLIESWNVRDLSLLYTHDRNRHDLTVLLNHFPNSGSVADSSGLKNKDRIVIALFTSIAAWQGSSGISDDEIGMIQKVIKDARSSMVISFGSPYILRHFKGADLLAAAYDTDAQVQSSVIRCMSGEKDFRGRLPVSISIS